MTEVSYKAIAECIPCSLLTVQLAASCHIFRHLIMKTHGTDDNTLLIKFTLHSLMESGSLPSYLAEGDVLADACYLVSQSFTLRKIVQETVVLEVLWVGVQVNVRGCHADILPIVRGGPSRKLFSGHLCRDGHVRKASASQRRVTEMLRTSSFKGSPVETWHTTCAVRCGTVYSSLLSA